MSNEFMVSIRMTTYNQEAYVAAALKGVLMQQVDFPVEIVIGDDFSTDRTVEIIKSFKDTGFFKIRLLDRQPGGEYAVQRKERGRLFNYLDTLRHCNGKYIALLDGDDYWVDKHKLTEQVKFLENHPDYSMTSHEVNVVSHTHKNSLHSAAGIFYNSLKFGSFTEFMKTVGYAVTFNNEFWNRRVGYSDQDRDYHMVFERMLFRKHFMATSSILFRGAILKDIPDWFTGSDRGHYLIIWILLSRGKNYHFNRFFGVYRKNPNSISMDKTRLKMINEKEKESLIFKLIRLREMVKEDQKLAIDKRLAIIYSK